MSPEVIGYIIKYGYFAIFLLVFLQEIGFPNPVPNELVLLFSGYLSFTGVLKLPLIILTVVSADFIGTNILYFTFYFFGSYIIKHKPSWFPVSEITITRLTNKISSGGRLTVFLGRITPFIRGYTSVITGLIQMKPVIFLPIALLSALTWSLGYVVTGRLLGPYWNRFMGNGNSFKDIMLLILLSVVLILVARYFITKKLRSKN